jgi:non-ribosomal peptide synthetase component F
MIRITSKHQAAVARVLAAEGLLSPSAGIPRVPDATRAPLTQYQRSLWLALRGARDSATQNVPIVFRICGEPLNTQALEGALRAIVERHEVLRSRIVVEGEEPWLLPQPANDLRLMEEHIAAEQVSVRIDEIVNQPLDVAARVAYEMRLLCVAADLRYLVVLTHHLVFDGASIGVLQNELRAAYQQLCSGQPLVLPELPVRHLDFALWQASDRARTARAAGLDYWRRLLQGANARIVWPDWTRLADPDQAGASATRMLPDELAARVRGFASRQRTTAYVVLVSAFLEVLSRYSCQRDFCIGTPASGRDRVELEKLIGYFINTLLLRYRAAPQRTFAQLVREMDAQFRSSREHQDIPFHAVMSATNVGRGAFQPFTQAMFAYQTEGSGTELGFECGTLRFEPHGYQFDSGRYDLLLTVLARSGRLAINFEYRTRVFTRPAIERLSDLYVGLLEHALSAPDEPLWHDSWSAGVVEQREPVHERDCMPVDSDVALLERAVAGSAARHHCDRVRISEQVSIAAERLRQSGVRPGDTLILVCGESEVSLLIALHAALYCGAWCIPVSAAVSSERLGVLRQRLRGARVLAPAARFLQGAVAPADLLLDALLATVPGVPYRRPPATPVSLSLAALINARFARDGELELTAFAATELLQALASTAAPMPAPDGPTADALASAFERVLALLTLAVSAGGATQVDGIPLHTADAPVQRLYFGSLSTPREYLADRTASFSYWLRVPESVVCVGTCQVGKGAVAAVDLADASRVRITDAVFGSVPTGAVGELAVAGRGLAWGYRGDARKTAERFVPDPYSRVPGARMVRTGEIVTAVCDGRLQSAGHHNTRVSRRGTAFDLSEIDTVLHGYEGVAAARVELVAEGTEERLVACIAVDSGRVVFADEVRRYLQDRLPADMVPARFRTAAALQRAADLTVVPASFAEPVREVAGDARRVTIEALLIEVWRSILGTKAITRDSNFFEMGGDSLLCLQVQSRAQKCGVLFSIETLFTHQTVAELAACCRLGNLAPVATGEFELVSEADRRLLPADAEAAYPLSRLQAGMLYQSRLAPDAGIYHDVIHYWLEGAIDAGMLASCVQEVLAQADTCRSTFHVAGFSEPVQIVHRGHRVCIEVLDHTQQSDATQVIDTWTGTELARGFDVRREVPIRCAIHRFASARSVLSYSFHHALLDGWSEAQIASDVFRLYADRVAGASAGSLGANATRVPYREFIALERAAEADAAQRTRWERYLSGVAPGRIPRVKNRADERSTGAAPIHIDAAASKRLQRLAMRLKVSVKSLLLAVHAKVLEALTGSGEVLTGMTFNGRPEIPGGDRALGLFLNTLPVRINAGRHGDWRSLAHACSQVEAELAAVRRFPLSAIGGVAGGRHFEVLYNYTHFHNFRPAGNASAPFTVSARTGVSANSVAYAANFWTDPADDRLYGVFSTPADETAQARIIAQLYERAIAALADAPDSPPPPLAQIYQNCRERDETAPEARTLVTSTATNAGGQPPRGDTEKVIASIWRDVLKVAAVSRDDDFYRLGGNSLAAMRMVAEIERIYEIDVPMATILTHSRLWQFCQVLEADGDIGPEVVASSRLLVEAYEARVRRDSQAQSARPKITQDSIQRLHQVQPGNARANRRPDADVVLRLGGGEVGAPMFLMHAIGGGVGCYLPLVQAMQPQFPVYGMRHPAILDAATLHCTLPELAQRYLSAVRHLQPQGPYRFAGWSLGGVLAHLMAAAAEDEGAATHPVLLIDSPTVTADGRFVGAESTLAMDGPQQHASLQAALRELQRIEASLHAEPQTLASVRAVQQSIGDALRACRLGRTACGVWYVTAGERSDASSSRDSWRAFTSGQFEARECPGDHYSILDLPNVAGLAGLCHAWMTAP